MGTDSLPMTVSYTTVGNVIKISLCDDNSGEIHHLDVESTEVTKVLAEHLVMSALSLDVLYGVRDMEAYRLAMFVALRSISRATCPPTI